MTATAFLIDWRCPQCGKTDRTMNTPMNAARMHQCPRLRGMTAPMVREGVDAQIVLREREDYVGRENVQLDPERRRPVMAMETRYADGRNDVIVYPPAATARSKRG